jgi:hypothetical protein
MAFSLERPPVFHHYQQVALQNFRWVRATCKTNHQAFPVHCIHASNYFVCVAIYLCPTYSKKQERQSVTQSLIHPTNSNNGCNWFDRTTSYSHQWLRYFARQDASPEANSFYASQQNSPLFTRVAKLHVRPFVRMEQLGSHWTDFHKNWVFFENMSSRKMQVSSKYNKNKGNITLRPYLLT